jgi:methionyl-tRNA formyltransferase
VGTFGVAGIKTSRMTGIGIKQKHVNVLYCINKDIYAYIFLMELSKLFPMQKSAVFYTQGVGKVNPYIQLMRAYEQDFPNLYASLSQELAYFDKLASVHHLQLVDVSSFNQDQLTEAIQHVEPDLIVSVRFGKIFKVPHIVIPPLGILNMHSGLLPDYRGILGTFWALKHQESLYGYTIHNITDATIDTGPILFTETFETQPVTCLFSAIVRLYPAAAKAMSRFIQQLEEGKKPQPLTHSNVNGPYYSTPGLLDFETFELPLVNKNEYLNQIKLFLYNDPYVLYRLKADGSPESLSQHPIGKG